MPGRTEADRSFTTSRVMKRTLCSTLLACAALLPPGTQVAPLDEAISELQLSWEVVR